MITRSKMLEILSKTDVKEERIKIIFESLTYEEAKNNTRALCCVADYDKNFDNTKCDDYILCKTCKLDFIERYKQYFKKGRKGNTLW